MADKPTVIEFIASLAPILGASAIGTWMRWGADHLRGRPWSGKRLLIEGVSVLGFTFMASALAEWMQASTTVACGIGTAAGWLGPKVVIGWLAGKVKEARS